jgi:hypothetical protein|tara:strand:- start:75 stop:245 length:171 start_codon:yes stop_codon:yes gene_type:complete
MGTGEPGTQLTLTPSWGEEIKTKVSSTGEWELEISTIKFGGPNQLTIQSGEQEIRV